MLACDCALVIKHPVHSPNHPLIGHLAFSFSTFLPCVTSRPAPWVRLYLFHSIFHCSLQLLCFLHSSSCFGHFTPCPLCLHSLWPSPLARISFTCPWSASLSQWIQLLFFPFLSASSSSEMCPASQHLIPLNLLETLTLCPYSNVFDTSALIDGRPPANQTLLSFTSLVPPAWCFEACFWVHACWSLTPCW